MKSSSDSPCPGRLTRRTATVTISAPEASMASRMFSNDGYFPVPTIRRDLNSFPPSQSDVSYMVPCLPYPLLLQGFMYLVSARLAFGCASPGYCITYPLGSPSAAPRQATALHIRSARLRLRPARLLHFISPPLPLGCAPPRPYR